MKTTGFPKPNNTVQSEFLRLCELGGGASGGPARGKVQELLRYGGIRLNKLGHREISDALAANPDANPWHVCFAMGLAWGHLAKLEPAFIAAAVGTLENWNADDVGVAAKFHNERGPQPIIQSLTGAYMLFEKVRLPDGIPTSLKQIGRAQERWFAPILSKERPPYIGSWNATAMFMTALFARPELAASLTDEPTVLLPPNGPIFGALSLLHRAHFLRSPPAGSELDDQDFEPGAIYENNNTFAEIRRGLTDWSLVDVHSGLYMLGTRDPRSDIYLAEPSTA